MKHDECVKATSKAIHDIISGTASEKHDAIKFLLIVAHKVDNILSQINENEKKK